MDREPPIPPYPGGAPYGDAPARRDRHVAMGLVGVALLVLVGSILWFTRSPGPPTAPVALRADPSVCADECTRIAPRVVLIWAPPDAGAQATGYRVEKDGASLDASIGAEELSFVDEDVTIGETYEYRVVATSGEGDSPATPVVGATVPEPSEDDAHLAGVYEVELRVVSARSIGAAFGIDNPLPGKRGTDRWSFESTCDADRGTCSSRWSGLAGRITPRGARWRGEVDGLPARCGGGVEAPAPIDLDLEAVDVGAVGAAWSVTGFRGTATVSFRCPGFPAASATIEVTGSL